MNLLMCLSKTTRHRERAAVASRSWLEQRGKKSHRWASRVTAMATAGVTLVTLITLSPPASLGGDCDDDDGHASAACCSPAATCCAAPVATCCAPPVVSGTSAAVGSAMLMTGLVSPGCAEENLGTIGGTTWYDVWKYCQPSGGCFGKIIEGWPHSDPDLDLCPDDIEECVDCIGENARAAENKPQANAVDPDVIFIPKEKDYTEEVKGETFFATVDGYKFKIMTIRTQYPGDLVRVRRIGVQVNKLPDGVQAKSSRWSAEAGVVGTSKYRHHIDVPFTRKGHEYHEQYRVTTATEADHPNGE